MRDETLNTKEQGCPSAAEGFPTQRDSIRPLDVWCNQNLSVHSIHTRLLNLGRLTPVGPVEETTGRTRITWKPAEHWREKPTKLASKAFDSPRQRIHGDGRWFFETSIEQNLLLGSVEVGNRYGFGAEVGPVQVLVDPVHRNADRDLDIFDHFLVSADFTFFVQYGPAGGKTWTKFGQLRVD